MVKISIVVVLCVVAFTTGQRITTIHLDGVQYFISRMNPYSPELNYFLAYQYCRSLGLQLASFETKEKAESMTTYLKNAGYGNFDFWTSGNRLGTGMFLWMSTGLPFNATFDFFGNSADSMQTGVLDPVDHNSNTSPQRTARDSSSGAENGCVILRQPTLKWMSEDCSAVKDFICEQTRCYYYNYGSIPVSSAQGRRITSTSATSATIGFLFSTTPMPVISSYASYMNKDRFDGKSYSPFVSLRLDHDEPIEATENPHEYNLDNGNYDKINVKIIEHKVAHQEVKADEDHYDQTLKLDGKFKHTNEKSIKKLHDHLKGVEHNDEHRNSEKLYFVKADNTVINDHTVKPNRSLFPSTNIDNTTNFDGLSVGKHLGQMFQKLEKVANGNKEESSVFKHQSNTDNITRKSLISLTDLIRTHRPNDKHIIPQIDSDYSNALRVLGETTSLVNTDDSLS